jgi:predicted PurR-regulated permease PerM
MYKFLFVILFFPVLTVVAQPKSVNVDSLLANLDQYIENKDLYFNQKLEKINKIKLQISKKQFVTDKFEIYRQLFNEYESFNYDSAYKYVNRLKAAALELHSQPEIAYAQTKLSFVLLSSGLFTESLDTLKTIKIHSLPDSLKIDYYAVFARTYYDLADYNKESDFAETYKRKGNLYLDTALLLTPKNSSAYWWLASLQRMKKNDFEGAREAFEYWIKNYKLDYHQYAIAASSLGYLYHLDNQKDKAIQYLVSAAIADIQSSTKETVALRNLADLLFKDGKNKEAYRYIKLALDDATFYNARHRKIEIATILPIIEGERLSNVESQRRQLMRYAIAITALSLLVLVFTFIIFRQLKKINKVKRILQNTNEHLRTINEHLQESNKIKEEYIGYFFNINSEYIEKLDAFQKTVNRKLISRQYDDLANIIKGNDLKRERESLFDNFDKIFLKIFPHFIEEFNLLFKEEDRIVLNNNELMNTDLRIFALMRLGIKDNEKIAKFLNYSVNTIYTYKTKLKNKTIVPRDLFDEHIMQIKAVQ